MALTHTCGWIYSAEDKFCRGCGERIFKVSRDYVEIMGEMNALKAAAAEKPHPAFAAVAMLMFNVLSWSSGEANTRPTELLKEVEKMADRFGGEGGGMGFGFPPSPPKGS